MKDKPCKPKDCYNCELNSRNIPLIVDKMKPKLYIVGKECPFANDPQHVICETNINEYHRKWYENANYICNCHWTQQYRDMAKS